MASDKGSVDSGNNKTDKRNTTDAKTFIKVWQTAPSVKSVCDKLGLLPSSASQRATNLRKRGVKLKKMPRNSQGYDLTELQNLADEYSPETQPEAAD